MQRSFPLRRRVTPATVILALAVGCSREEDLHERFDFIADYPNAECWFEQETIETGRYRDRSRLTDGWSFPEHDRDENAPPDSWVWANELEAKLSFWVREVAPRRVRFWASAYLPGDSAEKSVTHRLRTFCRRNQSRIAFCRMRWKSSGSSAAGRSPYRSVRRSIASWVMSSAASSSRRWNAAAETRPGPRRCWA